MPWPNGVLIGAAMATLSLPRGRAIEVIATVNAALLQQVEITGPDVSFTWSGTGEGKRIGHDALDFPPGGGDVSVEVRLSHSLGDGTWLPSHEQVIDARAQGDIQVIAEDGKGALDGNDLVVRFRWVP